MSECKCNRHYPVPGALCKCEHCQPQPTTDECNCRKTHPSLGNCDMDCEEMGYCVCQFQSTTDHIHTELCDNRCGKNMVEENTEIPMGISAWKNHGQKYGYWDYFREEIVKDIIKEIEVIRTIRSEAYKGNDRVDLALNDLLTKLNSL